MNEHELLAEESLLTNDYSVEITLTGDDFDPGTATEIMGLTPTKSGRKGEARDSGRNGSVWETGFWSREISSRESAEECRDQHLGCLADEIRPHIDKLRAIGLERVYFYFTLTSPIGMLNLRLKPETMRKLCDIEADLYVSCFDCFNPNHSFWKDGVAEKAS